MLSPHKTVLCQYRYDALDRLIDSSPQQTPQLQRFYCKSRLATEIQGTTQHSIIQHGDLLLAQQQREGNERNAHLLATDQQRSVLHTLNANSHSKPITYSPYGHRHPENGWLSLLGFNGERPDPVTGHYLLGNGYRAFNPVLMRFNSSDSWSPFGDGGLNAYAYCAGDPINKYVRKNNSTEGIYRNSRVRNERHKTKTPCTHNPQPSSKCSQPNKPDYQRTKEPKYKYKRHIRNRLQT